MSNPYRVSWEMVDVNEMYKYCGTDPRYYKNVTQIIPNSEIPDEDWHVVTRETDDPWDQYNTLKKWAEEGTEAIRNVKLEEMTVQPEWREITDRHRVNPAHPD